MLRLCLPVAALLATTSIAMSNEYADAMQNYLETEISSWLTSSDLINAIAEQNTQSTAYSQSEIDDMDLQWRAQVGSGNAPLVDAVLSNQAANFLRTQVEASGGTITEIFLMDARGLNVAASDATSDMWQGDEAKFLETFPLGASAAHFSEIEFDESSQRYQGQISVSMSDPASGEPIGAITIGVDAEVLASQ